MNTYPYVVAEEATLDLVLSGRSICRYGDGEFKMTRDGCGIKSQKPNNRLSARLREILQDSGECLVGIPNIHSATPKSDFWNKYTAYADLLSERKYVSSFISRPDSAPWINTDAYWQKVRQLWLGLDVTLVRGSGKAFTVELMTGAGEIREILGPKNSAFDEYDTLLARIGHPDRVILSLGPTATVLAVDLCARGVHAIDSGHLGCFFRKWIKAPEVEAA